MDNPDRSHAMVMQPRFKTEAAALMATTLAFAVLAYATTYLSWADGEPASIRIAGAMLLGVLLRRRVSGHWLGAYLVSAWVAWVVTSMLAGRGLALSELFGTARIGEIALAYVLLRAVKIDLALLRLRDHLWLFGISIVVAPFVGALVATGIYLHFRDTPALHTTLSWMTGNGVGMLTLLPAMVTWDPRHPWRMSRHATPAEAGALLIATVAVAWTSLMGSDHAYVLISLPLLLAAFRLDLLGTALLGLAAMLSVLAVHRWWLPTAIGLRSVDGSILPYQPAMLFGLCSVLPAILIAISERLRDAATRDAAALARRIALIADNVPAFIGYVDGGRRYRFVNQRYADWFGRRVDEIVGTTQEELLGSHRVPGLSDRIGAAFAGQRQVFESRVRDRDFEVHYIPDQVSGAPDAGVFVMAHDITDRKIAERLLFEEKERAQVTLDSIGDAVVACDRDMQITLLNPTAAELTGWTVDQAIGQAFADVVRLIDLESGQAALSPMKMAIRENRVVGLQANSGLLHREGRCSPIEDSTAPIRDRNGEVIGGVMVLQDVSESRAMASRMSHMAQHDYLTDLPNRVLLQDRLLQALGGVGRTGGGALLFVDLDRFKLVNDTLGHESGDAVLQQVARRLSELVRTGDTVSRQGGDEFVVLLQRVADPRDAANVARKIIAAIERPFALAGHDVHLSASVGIAMFPEDATDVTTLIKQADTALFHAKQEGRGRSSFFTRAMGASAERRFKLEAQLRTALKDQEFFLLYQPKVRVPQGEIVGMEALVRWRQPGTGRVLPPSEFVRAAEENGLITALDEWVMRTACAQNRAWQAAGLPVVPVAVNVSLAGLEPGRLLDCVRRSLADTGLEPGWLEIELTETAMLSRLDDAQDLVAELQALGVRVAMDDFGTGYSGLSYLAGLHFDTVKIDQSFVRGLPEDRKRLAIVQAIIGMGAALGYDVIAEGVETPVQQQCLNQLGCRDMQGYLYSRPVSCEAMGELLHRGCLRTTTGD